MQKQRHRWWTLLLLVLFKGWKVQSPANCMHACLSLWNLFFISDPSPKRALSSTEESHSFGTITPPKEGPIVVFYFCPLLKTVMNFRKGFRYHTSGSEFTHDFPHSTTAMTVQPHTFVWLDLDVPLLMQAKNIWRRMSQRKSLNQRKCCFAPQRVFNYFSLCQFLGACEVTSLHCCWNWKAPAPEFM